MIHFIWNERSIISSNDAGRKEGTLPRQPRHGRQQRAARQAGKGDHLFDRHRYVPNI